MVAQYVGGDGKSYNFLLSRGESIPIANFPGAAVTQALRISPIGDIVAFYVAGGKTHGFLLSSEQ